MKKNAIISLSVALLIIATALSCSKSSSSAAGKQNLTMFLTDAPGDYEHVYVDIRAVFVKVESEAEDHSGDDNGGSGNDDSADDHSNGDDEWINLNANAQVYDLLALNNGIDALLANSDIKKGQVHKIKIEIGSNNSIVKNGVTYPLNISAEDAEVEIECEREDFDDDGNSQFRIWLDFDVSSSVIEMAGNIFWLKPYISLFNQTGSGEVEGRVSPANGVASIKLYNSNNTYFAIPEDEGEFKIRGVKAGTYTMEIIGKDGYKNETRSNLVVKTGEDTKVENIVLTK